MPTKRLSGDVTLADLIAATVTLLEGRTRADGAVLQRLREFYPSFRELPDEAIARAPFRVDDAKLAIAREYGFFTWNSLERRVAANDVEALRRPYVERITGAPFRAAVEMLDRGDVEDLRTHLAVNPELAAQRVQFEGGNYFQEPSLLEFVAENPTRRGASPPNVAEIATVILDTGNVDQQSLDSTLELVSSSSVARESGVQTALIDLLLDRGAKPGNSMVTALLYGEFSAVDALLRRGAAMDLAVASGTGRVEAARVLAGSADETQRQVALALAAQHGHLEIVRILLDAGADPNRYSPVGGHSHATPLHQAALAGHEDIVRLLIERGARPDIRDIHYDATPLDWANHAAQLRVAQILREATGPSR